MRARYVCVVGAEVSGPAFPITMEAAVTVKHELLAWLQRRGAVESVLRVARCDRTKQTWTTRSAVEYLT